MAELSVFLGLGVALACGLVIGLDRERVWAEDEGGGGFGGIRTFPLISLLGGLSAVLAPQIGAWFMGVVLAGLLGWLGIYYWHRAVTTGRRGLTSEVAAVVAWACGVLAAQGRMGLGFAVAISVTLILSLREWLHATARSLAPQDMEAALKFLVVAFVVLPLLPRTTYTATLPPELWPGWMGLVEPITLDLFNPAKVGWMVVLIAGLGFVGYVASKLMAAKKGLGLTAFLGGLVSSTAVTLSFAGRAKATPTLVDTCAVAILLASSTMFVRVLVEVAAVAPALLPTVLVPVGAMGACCVLACGVFWLRSTQEKTDGVELDNPFELREALKFGALFALVLLLAGAAQQLFGHSGLYLSALVTGLTDVDAITLTAAQLTLAERDPISKEVATTTIVLATISNTLTKGLMALSLGGRALGWRVWTGFGAAILVGALLAWWAAP